MAKRKLKSASEIMHDDFYAGKSAERIQKLKATISDLALGDKIRELREQHGLTQEQLAGLIGTTASQISRIEDADYDSHSVQTLRRIAGALHSELRIRFVKSRRSDAVSA